MIKQDFRFSLKSCLPICLLVVFFAGCTGITIKDELPPSAPRGYVDFAKYSLNYDVIYSMKGSQRIREGGLGYTGDTLRLARTPGNYEFVIEHRDDSGKKVPKLVNVKIGRDALTFVTIDNKLVEVIEGTNYREPSSTIIYKPSISVAQTPAPIQFGSEADSRDILLDLFHDPDWRARLYAVNSLGKMKGPHDEGVMKAVTGMASDDPDRTVRRKAAAFLKDLGIDPFKDVLLLENFESNNKRRWISSKGQYTYFYNDEFLLSSSSGKCENQMMTAPLDLPRAFDVELLSTWKTGTDTDAYGLVIGSDRDEFDHFGLSGEGKAVVRPTRYNEQTPDLIPWTGLDSINRHGSNRLKVEARGDKWSYYVNGAYVGTVQNTRQPGALTVGLRVCQGQTVSFDQLKISRVKEN